MVRDLSLADRQLIEIAKAMRRQPKVLILDEATSALNRRQVQQVFTVVRRLSAEGVAVVFISHRMDEVRDLCHRATIFRDGVNVGTVEVAKARDHEIVRMMIGRTLRETFPTANATAGRRGTAAGGARSQLGRPPARHLPGRPQGGDPRVSPVSKARDRAISSSRSSGSTPVSTATSALGGKPIRLGGPRDAMTAGLALVPEDRKTQGLILPLPVDENVTLPTLPDVSRSGVISPAAVQAATMAMRDRLAIRMASPAVPVRFLSGGNQQKVSIAKWLLTDAAVYLLYDPTRGIDVGAKQEIYELMRRLASEGHGILFFSTDLAEIVGLCDRALVMYEGAIARELRGAALTEANLVSAAVGLAEAVSA